MDLVLDPNTWPRWQPEIVSLDGPARVDEGDVSTGDAIMLGFHVVGQSRAIAVTDRSFDEDVVVGVHMRVHYEVEPRGDGVTISRRIEAVLPRGLLGRPLAFMLRRRLRSMQKEVLDQLAAQSEAAARS